MAITLSRCECLAIAFAPPSMHISPKCEDGLAKDVTAGETATKATHQVGYTHSLRQEKGRVNENSTLRATGFPKKQYQHTPFTAAQPPP